MSRGWYIKKRPGGGKRGEQRKAQTGSTCSLCLDAPPQPTPTKKPPRRQTKQQSLTKKIELHPEKLLLKRKKRVSVKERKKGVTDDGRPRTE